MLLTGREICVSKGNLQQIFTETRLGNIDLSKTQPYKYLFIWGLGNPSHKNSNIL